MSISTPSGEQRKPSVVSTSGKKPPAGGKPASGGTGGKQGTGAKRPAGAGGRPGGAGGGKGPRKPITPVKVTSGRPWGAIGLVALVGVIAVGIIGYGAYAVIQGAKSWEDKADGISGIVNYRKKDPNLVKPAQHQTGSIKYDILPPVAGPHNAAWQNCMGDVYDAPIANEHAVHSLEHGAVWITYQPNLPADQVSKLAEKVRGKEKMMMSPFEGLDKPISLQAWGYQLKVDNADDSRIDEFIKDLRVNASVEGPTISCAEGITATGNAPRELQPQQQMPNQ
ncbi:DUF3105 domain-containing protein [Micromonospora sp. NPDC049559]|uniref:DUF3105 domain-containing protein n=1 Tax=Micromonospora sp. NPDC049559 TaxID=3155923 RepID=UPI00341B4684